MSARNENGAQRPIQGAQESGNLLVVASLPEVAVGKPAPASTNRNNGNVQVERFLNREMSWLDFADRLLDIADDSPISLLERARFLAIFSGGMDEFFQVRVAGLKDQVAAGVGKRSPDGLTANEQLSAISGKVSTLVDRLGSIYANKIVPGLAENSVFITDYPDLDEAGKARLSQVFDDKIFPVLTPLAVDPGHPFPYISDLSLNLAVTVTDTSTGLHRFSRVKVPPLLPRYMRVEDTPKRQVLVPIEQVIAENLACLFPGMQIGSHHSFRVTRNADLALEEDDADDLLSAVEMELRRRRFGRAVRLEIDSAATSDIRELLLSELELDSSDVYEVDVPVDLGGLWSIIDLKRPELKLPTWTPVVPTPLATSEGEPADIFRAIRERDILVHHPYESFSASVEKFIEVACGDPDVLAIKQTLYRTSGDSPIVKSLIKAAESGKQVAVLVELKARFDEQRNIDWAKQLEKAGVHVVYGLVGLKTHAKTALIIRSEDDGIRRYCHIGTGNYNPSTARIYEDIGLFSASNDLGADLSELFNFLTGYSRRHVYRKIVVAPTSLHDRIIRLIGDQAALGTEGRVVIKVNGLTHPDIIDALYGASQAGVPIDLIVRGICMLRPGVPGLSETIRVRSIVGRFLEHSRIYSFGSQDSLDSTVLIGSADLMERNLDHRVEAVVPVEDVGLRKRLIEILKLNLEDDTSSWELGSNGEWVRVTNCTDTSLQDSLMLRAISEDRQRRLSGQLSPTVR